MIDLASMSALPAGTLVLLIFVTAVAGLARGFSGFGAGLIIMPVASALLDPLLAVAIFALADFVFAAPLLPNAFRRADWPTVLPAGIAAVAAVPFGVWALVVTDPTVVRWALSSLTLAMLVLLVSGWRYQGRPHMNATLGVGAIAGFLGGLSQMPGPPIVTYWMSGPAPAKTIRANLICFFLFTSVVSMTSYIVGGLITPTALVLALMIAPVYGLSIWIGARLHGHAPENLFRLVVYGLIALAALTSVPALDPFLGHG